MATKSQRESPDAGTRAVEAFLATLDSPSKPALLAARKVIRGADARIAEGIKWNAPSFRTSDWFATFNLRAKQGVQLILHRGAKVRADAMGAIPDPEGLLKWLGPDRALLQLGDAGEIDARRGAIEALMRHWVDEIPP